MPYFDASIISMTGEAGLVIINLTKQKFPFSFKLNFLYTDNMVGYEVIIIVLYIILDIGAKRLKLVEDSMIVIQQIRGNFIKIAGLSSLWENFEGVMIDNY